MHFSPSVLIYYRIYLYVYTEVTGSLSVIFSFAVKKSLLEMFS